MSESSKKNTKTLSPRTIIIIVLVLVFVVMLGGYASGYFILPNMIRSAYSDGNCETVLSRNDLYSGVYPFAVANEVDSELIRECAVYTLAIASEEAKSWRDSYNAFSVYSETYPNGLFTDAAHEHSAVVLMSLINEDVEQGNYSQANAGINDILENYGDTPTAADAEKLKSNLRIGLGKDLRATGDFAGAERIFKELNAQAQENNQADDVKLSQLELAQTHLDWGQELQSQENFAEARAKFDIAISIDPDPSAGSGPAAQANASLAGLYTQWGDYLITQKDFANAMARYKTAATLSGSDDPSAANDIIAKGYIQWAAELINGEDFLGALVLLDFAQESGGTDTIKTLVDDVRSDLYLAFSNSDGEQAQKEMQDAVRIVCVHHIQPSLPIFGLDQSTIRARVYGTEEPLPESIAAVTPASLHYAACIEEDTRRVEELTIYVDAKIYCARCVGTAQRYFQSFQYFWNVSLRKIDGGDKVGATAIDGDKPVKLDPLNINTDARFYSFFGAKPDIEDLADWIEAIIK